MFTKILKFEWQYHSRQLSFIAAAAIFFVMGIGVSFGNFGGSEVNANSPYAITFMNGFLSLLSLFVLTVFCVNAVLRDSANKMEGIIFTTAITKFQYLGGKFIGLLTAALAVLAIAVCGMMVGSFFVDADRLGPFSLWYYLRPLFLFGLPNLLFGGVLLFGAATLTRNATATYVCGVFIYILYFAGSMFGNSPMMANANPTGPQNDLLPVLLDPYGLVAFFGQARYWTPLERNTLTIALEGNFLINRLFWISVSLLLFGLIYRVFSFRVLSKARIKKTKPIVETPPDIPYRPTAGVPDLLSTQLTAFLSKTGIELRMIYKSIPFLVLMIMWVFLVSVSVSESIFQGMFGTANYPTSGLIITMIHEPLTKIGIFMVIFYSAELISRERGAGINELIDATPTVNWVMFLAKFTTLVAVIATFILISIVVGIIIQLINGHFNIEPSVYVLLFYYGGMPLVLIAAFALFLQSLLPGKYLGMILTAAFFLYIISARNFGLEHFMVRYAITPELIFSDMNNFGHYASAFNWYMLYWGAAAGLLILAAIGLWNRGTDVKLKQRFLSFPREIGVAGKWIAAACLLVFLASGSYIFKQTNIENKYASLQGRMDHLAGYEKTYKRFAGALMPTITGVKLKVDLYPSARRYHIDGSFRMKHTGNLPIDTLVIGVDREVTSVEFEFPGTSLIKYDDRFKHYWLKTDQPLMPGQERNMTFTVDVQRSSFIGFNSENSILSNGSYIELEKYVPFFGYSERMELRSDRERKKRGLPKQQPVSPVIDETPQMYDWIEFESIISTAPDQTIVHVGELQKEWQENGRRYFHFKTAQPIRFMFACASGKYEVARSQQDGIDIAIYYQPGHDYNVPQLMEAAKQSLAYFGENFSPYQHRHLRIAEIPQYVGAATAYPGTIFWTERFGFLLDTRRTDKLNYVYLGAAHEIGHQWWAYQLDPANTAGASVLTETLAQYSEVLLLEEQYGKSHLRSLLKNELDTYLTGRGYEEDESPLYLSGGRNQTHIFYQKGTLILNALKAQLGKETVNLALQNLLKAHQYPGRKATTLDLLAELYHTAPETDHHVIDDLMKKIVIYDLEVESATYTELDDSRYQVKLKIRTERHFTESDGSETPAPVNEKLEIAIFAAHPDRSADPEDVLFSQNYHFTEEITELSFIVDREPKIAAIDPYIQMIDRNRFDNLKAVEIAEVMEHAADQQ